MAIADILAKAGEVGQQVRATLTPHIVQLLQSTHTSYSR